METVKPIEVTCFLDENKLTIEKYEYNSFRNIRNELSMFSEKPQTDVTATMMTIVPQRKRPISAPMKKPVVVPVTDMIVGKPIRHLAILPSSKETTNRDMLTCPTSLSGRISRRQKRKIFLLTIDSSLETFTMYDGPATTPVVGQSLDETITIE